MKFAVTGVNEVAPRAGAWIETIRASDYTYSDESHPMRVRGLKPISTLYKGLPLWSHPVRVRGLKLFVSAHSLYNPVAPRAGAWIETIKEGKLTKPKLSHPVRVCGLK